LELFSPKRLLRAATYGRSVWEISLIDAPLQPATDIYIRDNLVDTGLTTPSLNLVADPLNPSQLITFYNSLDIKVDVADSKGNYQTPTTDIDYIQFEDMVHQSPKLGTEARVYVQVNCRGYEAARNVQVRAFYANASGGLPQLPSDLWSTTPTAITSWHAVGDVVSIKTILPGSPKIASWIWNVPLFVRPHTCIIAIARCDNDPITTKSVVVDQAVVDDNNIALRNLHIIEFRHVIESPVKNGISGPYHIDFHPSSNLPFDIRINPGTLPKDVTITFMFPEFKTSHTLEKSAHNLKIKKSISKKLVLRERPDERNIQTQYNPGHRFIFTSHGSNHIQKELPGIYGIIPSYEKLPYFSAAFFLTVPKKVLGHSSKFTFNLEQWTGNHLHGGSQSPPHYSHVLGATCKQPGSNLEGCKFEAGSSIFG